MKKTKKALASLAIASMLMTAVPFNAFADNTATRIFGSSRVETAIYVAQQGWTTAATVIVAPAADANLVDALAAAPLAGQENAPILLTDGATLDAKTKQAIIDLGATKVIAVGALSTQVVTDLQAISGVTVEALKGADRIETASKISAKLTSPAGSFVVGYSALADALSVASYAAANKYQILVANTDGSLPSSQVPVGTKFVIGGPTLVKDGAVAGATRLYGQDRFATNTEVLKTLTGQEYDKVYVANGEDGHLVDSLVASSLAAKTKSPIALTDNVSVKAQGFLGEEMTASSITIALGGPTLVSEAIRAGVKEGAVVVTPPTTGVAGVSAVNMSAAKSVATGQALVDVGTVTVNGGTTGSSITGIKMTRSGLSADTTIASISVWNGTTRLNVPNILSNGVAEIGFSNPLALAAGQSATLTIKVNIAPGAIAGAQFALTLNELTGASSNLFPATSGTMTVTSVALGTLAVVLSGDAPSGTLDAGTTDVRLAKFDFTANTEAQLLKVLTLTQNNSIGDADLANLKLYNNGVQVGATAAMSNRKVTFAFGDGIDIASGGTARLELRGDVLGGSGRSVQFDINDANDVQSYGKTFGTTIVGNNVNGVVLAVNPGNFIVSKATTSPVAGTIATVLDDQAFSTIKVEAVGEAIQLQTARVTLALGGAANLTDLRDLKLVCDGKIIAQVTTPTFVGAVEAVTLTSPITVKPGTPAIITITADIPLASAVAANDTYALGIATGVSALTGVGTISGITRNYTAPGNIMGNIMTVGAIQLTATRVPKSATNIFPSDAAAELVSFNLSHNLSEDVSVSMLDLVINDNGGGNVNGIAGNFTNMKVLDSEGNVISNVVTTPGTTTSFNFNTPIVLKANTTVKVTVKSDVLSTANATDNYDFGVANTSVARTVALGTGVTFPAVAAGGTVFTINAGGANLAAIRSAVVNLDTNFNVQRNSKDVPVAAYRLTNTGAEAGVVKSIYLNPTYVGGLGAQHVSNIRIVDASDATKIYATISDLAAGKLIDVSGLEVGTNATNTVDIKVLADFSATATFGGSFGVALGDAVGGVDIRYQAKTTGQSTDDAAIFVAQTETARVTASKVNVAPVTIPNPVTVAGAAVQGNTIAKFTFINNGASSVNMDSIRLTDTMGTLDAAVGTTVQIIRTSTGVALSAPTAIVGNTDITLTTALRLDAGGSDTISVRVVLPGTLVSGNAVSLRVLSSGTVYESIATPIAGGLVVADDPLTLTVDESTDVDWNANYTVEDNKTSDVVTFVAP